MYACLQIIAGWLILFACRNHRITEQVVIGTHGTLKNLTSKRILLFRHIRILVFDEADEMLKVLQSVSHGRCELLCTTK